jgi:hypothetical protein
MSWSTFLVILGGLASPSASSLRGRYSGSSSTRHGHDQKPGPSSPPDARKAMRSFRRLLCWMTAVLGLVACRSGRRATGGPSDGGADQALPEWLTKPPECAIDGACPPGLKCAPLMASMGCLVPCQSDKDCPGDWVCCCRDAGCTYRSCADPPPGFCDPPPRPRP